MSPRRQRQKEKRHSPRANKWHGKRLWCNFLCHLLCCTIVGCGEIENSVNNGSKTNGSFSPLLDSNIHGYQTNEEGNFHPNPPDNIPILSTQIHLLQQLQTQDKAINSANRNPFMKFIDYSNPVVVGSESQQPINLTTNAVTNIKKHESNEAFDDQKTLDCKKEIDDFLFQL